MDFLKALGSDLAKLIAGFAKVKALLDQAKALIGDHWWNVAVYVAAILLAYFGFAHRTDVISFVSMFIGTPAGSSMLINLLYLGIGLVLLRLLIFWANHSSVTGKDFEVHLAFDKIFGDARASADLLGKLAIACAIVVFAFVRG